MRKAQLSEAGPADGAERTNPKCRCEAGLNQQTQSAQVEAMRWRREFAWREGFSMTDCYQGGGSGCIDCEPFQGGVIGRQYCIHPDTHGSGAKGVAARRVRATVRASRMRIVRGVRRLRGGDRLRNVIGVAAKNCSHRLAARK